MRVIGGDVSAINLLRADIDTRFVSEASRLLKPNGTACIIIPLFLSNTYAEVWNIKPENHYDGRAIILLDRTASLPGAKDDGHFAIIYDLQSLTEKILKTPKDYLWKNLQMYYRWKTYSRYVNELWIQDKLPVTGIGIL